MRLRSSFQSATVPEDGREQDLTADVLQEVRLGTRLEATEDVLVGIVGGQDDRAGRRNLTPDRKDGLNAAHPRQPEVHQRHVRAMRLVESQGLRAGRGLTDHVHVVLFFEYADQTVAYDRVVVGNQNTNHAPAAVLPIDFH